MTELLAHIRTCLNEEYVRSRLPIFEMLADETKDSTLLLLYRTMVSAQNRPVADEENIISNMETMASVTGSPTGSIR